MIKEVFDNLLAQTAPGPAVSFTVFDLFRAIELIAEKQPIGRIKMSHKLALGGGVIRTLVKRLNNSGLIITSKSGCSLTNKGEDLWRKVKLVIPVKKALQNNEMTSAKFNIAVLIRDSGKKVRNGLEQRDAAVRVGAEGAVTMIFEKGKLAIPGISLDISEEYFETFYEIKLGMNPRWDDVIVVAYAKSLENAESGALAAAWTLID